MSWHATVLTLFPEMFPGTLGHSLAGKALEKGIWSLETLDIRQFATDKHGTVDDTPYGGGAGMVMRADIIAKAVEAANQQQKHHWIYLTPRGKPLQQPMTEAWLEKPAIGFLCGRYEGVDQRVVDYYSMEEVSIGDYVLSGGEIAAQVAIDACVRQLSGVLNNMETHSEESFARGKFEHLLEYPHYTRPAEWNGLAVPEVLLSGHHGGIEAWRLQQSEALTEQRRKDLWDAYTKKRR